MKKYRHLTSLSLIALCLVAGAIRLNRLDEMDTKGDEVWLLEYVRSGGGLVQYWNFHWGDFKTGRSMFLPRMAAAAMIKWLGLEPNRFNGRLPYALAGILTIPALFLLGLRLGDGRLAWILAFLGTINPYLVFYSRVAHIYAFPLFFNVLVAAFAGGIIRALQRKERPQTGDVVWFVVASILGCHSHISSWALVGMLWVPILGQLILFRHNALVRSAAGWLSLALAIWFLSILPWVYVFISALFTAQESFLKGGTGPVVFVAMWRLPFVMAWGGGMPRLIITIGLILAGMVGGLLSARWRAAIGVTLALSLLLFVGLSLITLTGGAFFNLRYYTPLWLTFHLLSALGILLLAEWIVAAARRGGGKGLKAGVARSNAASGQPCVAFGRSMGAAWVAAALCGVVAAFMAGPIYWTLRLPGNPAPYSLINRWMDANLAKGSLVIVDRWFEPWNEMRYHAPSNLYLAFTIPNEPNEVLVKYNWTRTVQDFFAEYPDSAYLELVKKSPVIGQAWEWPRRHFARHMVFTNQYALWLRQVVLAPEESYYYDDTNRIITELFYDTRADAVEKARQAGRETLVCYGTGWGYVKLWQQLKDFRDWRVLEEQATLDVYNLTSRTNTVTLLVRGMAINGSKRVRFGSISQADFQNLQLAQWRVDRLSLKPGLNQFVLTDAFWPAAKNPLLVDQVEVMVEDLSGQQSEVSRR
ncbi:MAG: hypothetical protein HYV35_12975 [Lentisphaerae bacterium]|nr:hypothetical protein [Lentisphaerota bacterium]